MVKISPFFNKCFEIDDDGKLEDFERIYEQEQDSLQNKDRQISFLRQWYEFLGGAPTSI